MEVSSCEGGRLIEGMVDKGLGYGDVEVCVCFDRNVPTILDFTAWTSAIETYIYDPG